MKVSEAEYDRLERWCSRCDNEVILAARRWAGQPDSPDRIAALKAAVKAQGDAVRDLLAAEVPVGASC